jgi:hypothetical protein
MTADIREVIKSKRREVKQIEKRTAHILYADVKRHRLNGEKSRQKYNN